MALCGAGLFPRHQRHNVCIRVSLFEWHFVWQHLKQDHRTLSNSLECCRSSCYLYGHIPKSLGHMRYMAMSIPVIQRNFLGSEGGAAGYEGGTKRQRSLDGGPFFGGSPATLQPNLMYGGSFSSPFLGHARAFPVVRLRGLPFNCTEADVFEFFAGLDVVDVLLVHKQERFSGEAFCVFGAPMQVEFALQKNRQNMGRRYIEVFRSKKQEYYQAVANEVSEPKTNVPSTFPPVRSRSHDASKDNVEHTGVLKLRGLPFSASKRDILEFFKEFDLTDDNVHIVVHSDGRATGEAYVEFSSPNDSKSAMNKDKMTLGSRYVELFPSSQEEAARAAAKR